MTRTTTADGATEASDEEASAASRAEAEVAAGQETLVRETTPVASPFGEVSAATRKCMQGNKRRDTTPELKVRRMLRELGFPGYRKIAIFIHGCYWHHCPTCNLPIPKKNPEYWEAKFRRNQERDERTRAALEADGWKVAVIWEPQLKKAELENTERYLYEIVRWDDPEDAGDSVPVEDPRTAAETVARTAEER